MSKISAAERVSESIARLLLTDPFLSVLTFKLKVREVPEDHQVQTAATDGTRLFFNPKFVDTLTNPELIGLLAHEVFHCAFLHPYRIGGRDPEILNIAGDLIINQILHESGYTLPKGGLLDNSRRWSEMTLEEAYAIIWEEIKKNKSNIQQSGKSGLQSTGEFSSAGSLADSDPDGPEIEGEGQIPQNSETDWQMAREQAAMQAKRQGKLPAGLERLIGLARQPKPDWREQLRRFIQSNIPQDYSWIKPNKSFIAQDIYLPGVHRENCPKFTMTIDTSGSIDQVLLDQFASEIQEIMNQMRPEKIEVIYCDADINNIEEFDCDDDLELSPQGGGGTDFRPAFNYIDDCIDRPACVFYFTDLMGTFPEEEPEYPVLWVVPQPYADFDPPWGEKIVISLDD